MFRRRALFSPLTRLLWIFPSLPVLVWPSPLSAGQGDVFTDVIRPVFVNNCAKCHGKAEEVAGEINLWETRTSADLVQSPELIGVLIEVLEEGAMPPEDEPALPLETRETLLTQLREMLRTAVASNERFPRTPMRRMNRFQYSNAVRDLFDLNVDVFSLPERMLREYGDYFQPASGTMPEQLKAGSRPLGKSQLISPRLEGVAPFPQDLRAEHSFDNRGDHLSLSPLLMESFLKLSQSIVQSRDFHEQTCGIWNEFFAKPEDEAWEPVVRRRLKTFLHRAFRRPIDRESLERYVQHVTDRLGQGESFPDSMKEAASAALASPRFLYLYDGPSEGPAPQPVDDFELASRLSFFLWGSIPDQTLLDLAGQERLSDSEVLSQQVDRMLSDRRMKRFCDSFPAQWLQLERIISSVPDPERYPEFYFAKYRVSMHMMLEPLLLFETMLIENRSILELIDSDFSYRSDLLDSWYDSGRKSTKAPPTAIPFRRLSLVDRRQGGVITSAAVMTMTSGPSETKPITRGAWMATVIFNDPPEPPPADVPPLPERDVADEDLTLRERFAAHRKRADCKGCHAQIDPLGFALENFGPTGVWRETYESGRTVDPSGTLFRQHEFTDLVAFKDAILTEKDRFARAFAEHLLSFALGREIDAADWPALEQIVQETANAQYRFRPLIQQVILSEPFLTKYNPATGPPNAN